ncbi:hypothetical protein BHM03_00022128 [Ensete ventricosum]|nr:hypothetical protein BHM03_00022128 [Ensete ventricosum]
MRGGRDVVGCGKLKEAENPIQKREVGQRDLPNRIGGSGSDSSKCPNARPFCLNHQPHLNPAHNKHMNENDNYCGYTSISTWYWSSSTYPFLTIAGAYCETNAGGRQENPPMDLPGARNRIAAWYQMFPSPVPQVPVQVFKIHTNKLVIKISCLEKRLSGGNALEWITRSWKASLRDSLEDAAGVFSRPTIGLRDPSPEDRKP